VAAWPFDQGFHFVPLGVLLVSRMRRRALSSCCWPMRLDVLRVLGELERAALEALELLQADDDGARAGLVRPWK
jgi:hypothetical protein